jgi:hypothetical protein
MGVKPVHVEQLKNGEHNPPSTSRLLSLWICDASCSQLSNAQQGITDNAETVITNMKTSSFTLAKIENSLINYLILNNISYKERN